MSGERDDDLLIAVTLTRLSVQFEATDPELAGQAWQLAADRLLKHDIELKEVVAELEMWLQAWTRKICDCGYVADHPDSAVIRR